MFFGSFVRYATVFSLLAGILAFSAPSASAQGRLYVNATGAYAFVLADNVDATNDGIADKSFLFTHYQVGSFTGVPDKAVYNSIAKTISHEGAINNRPTIIRPRFSTQYNAIGGYYGLGSSTLLIYSDANNNRIYDLGERIYVNIQPLSPLRINGATYVFPSGKIE